MVRSRWRPRPHFTALASDQDAGDQVRYSLGADVNLQAPVNTGASIDPATGVFTWVANDEGTYVVHVIASDLKGIQAIQDVSITVGDAVPKASTVPALSGAIGQPLTLQGSYTSPAPGDVYSLTWHVTADNGQVLSDGTGPSFTFTPLDDGTYTATFTVTDVDDGSKSTATATATATVTVASVGPLASPLPPTQTANAGTRVSLMGSYSDAINSFDVYTFNWQVSVGGQPFALPAGTVTNAPSFSFTPPDAGAYALTFTVTDEANHSSGTTMTLNVQDVPPTAGFVNNGASAEGAAVTARFSNPFDPAAAVMAAGFHYSYATDPSQLADHYGDATAVTSTSTI